MPHFHSLTARVPGLLCSSHFVELFFCPAGWVARSLRFRRCRSRPSSGAHRGAPRRSGFARSRHPTAIPALGARELQRIGDAPRRAEGPHPLSGLARFGAMAPIARGADFTTTLPHAADLLEPSRQTGHVVVGVVPPLCGRGAFNPPSGWQRPCLPRPRGPSARTGTGCRGSREAGDTEGPRHETRCWVAVVGVSARSERGRASDEGPRTRLAKQSRYAVTRKKRAAHPRGKRRARRGKNSRSREGRRTRVSSRWS